jgi:hypothetical protein
MRDPHSIAEQRTFTVEAKADYRLIDSLGYSDPDCAWRPLNELIIAPSQELQPAPLFAPTRKAARRFLEFFTAQINNAHTRRAYLNATRRFAGWCASKDIHELTQVQPFHVAAFVHDLQEELSPPSVKQHLAAILMLFDWLVTGHVIDTNPAHSVRGPRYTVEKGKISRALSTIALSERFSKHCVCIWVLLICVRLVVELPAGRFHLLNNICLVAAGLLRLHRSFVQETAFSDDRRTYMQEVPTDDEIVMWP